MEKKMTFNYFYGTEADQFSFYRIPKALFTDSYFKDLSSDAKILYGLMLDRMSLSIKNQWFDDKNRAYIYFSIEDIITAGMADPFCDRPGSEDDSTDLCGCKGNPWFYIHFVDYSNCILLP